ncbi:MAG: hypothetical protein H0V07_13405 [Propionibacteriales bacterium]|nr:hypothetical protein [Propionibacteriales bacterium]
MKRRWFRAGLGAGVTAVVIATTSTAAAAATFGAHWAFDEPASPPPTTAFDSSGNNNNGTNENIAATGTSYAFNGTSSRVVVPDGSANSLDPGTADFTFSVTVTTDLPAAGTDYDLLRKGLASTAGGDYKAEILNVNGVPKAFCLVKDSLKRVASVRGGGATGHRLDDGFAHTISCVKTSTSVTLTVDPGTAFTKTYKKTVTTLGSVSNAADLTIGAKSGTGGDWFSGTMLDAQLF